MNVLELDAVNCDTLKLDAYNRAAFGARATGPAGTHERPRTQGLSVEGVQDRWRTERRPGVTNIVDRVHHLRSAYDMDMRCSSRDGRLWRAGRRLPAVADIPEAHSVCKMLREAMRRREKKSLNESNRFEILSTLRLWNAIKPGISAAD